MDTIDFSTLAPNASASVIIDQFLFYSVTRDRTRVTFHLAPGIFGESATPTAWIGRAMKISICDSHRQFRRIGLDVTSAWGWEDPGKLRDMVPGIGAAHPVARIPWPLCAYVGAYTHAYLHTCIHQSPRRSLLPRQKTISDICTWIPSRYIYCKSKP